MNACFRQLLRVAYVATLCALFTAAAPTARAADDLGTSVGLIVVPEGVPADSVRQIVVYSLTRREWTVTEKSDTKVVGQLKHRGKEAIVTFVPDGKGQIAVYCAGWKIDRNGNRLKPEMPERWIANIKKDVTTRLVQKAADL